MVVWKGLPPTSSGWNENTWRSRGSVTAALTMSSDAAVGAQPDEIGQHLHHVGELGERLVDERHARVEHLLALASGCFEVALLVGGIECAGSPRAAARGRRCT
jgi:hypothetical protein